MAEPDIKELFEKNRFPKAGWQILSLLLYSPIGIVLAVLRIFIAAQALIAAVILPEMSAARRIILRTICGVLGITVSEKSGSVQDKSAQVIVANSVTQLDFLVVHLATGCITEMKDLQYFEGLNHRKVDHNGLKIKATENWDLPSPLAWVLGIEYMGQNSRKQPDISKLRAHLDKRQSYIFLQPEESSTSGKVGLLKFSQWVAKVSDKVQPVVIEASRPSFAEVACDVLGSTVVSELFWFLFSPTTLFTLRYLPVMKKEPDETDEKFTERIESAIASDLDVQTTSHTAADKEEYEKRYLIEYNQPVLITSSGQSSLPCAELQQMATQVKEVLPHVPMSVILQDLSRTHSVDITISNILEGSVPFTPVQQQQIRPDPVPSNVAQTKNHPVSSSQGQGTMISFMERKAKLIADARRKYIEKHGLVDAWAE